MNPSQHGARTKWIGNAKSASHHQTPPKSARLSRTAIQTLGESERWIPAFAGMTAIRVRVRGIVGPSKAGIHFHRPNRGFFGFST